MDGAAEDTGIPRRLEEEEDGDTGRYRSPAKLRGAAGARRRAAGTAGGPANAAAGSRVRASAITPSNTKADNAAPADLMFGETG